MKPLVWTLVLTILPEVYWVWAVTADYQLKFSEENPRLVDVTAYLSIEQPLVKMGSGNIPAEIPKGWAEFVRIKSISTTSGKPISFRWESNSRGWKLTTNTPQEITVEYQVNLAHDQYNWNSVGGKDACPTVFSGPTVLWATKGLFLIPYGIDLGAVSGESLAVSIRVPDGWKVSTAWLSSTFGEFQVDGYTSLLNNFLMVGHHLQVLTQYQDMSITWAITEDLQEHAELFSETLEKVLPVYQRVFDELPQANYLVCASANSFEDGEAFNNSFHQMFPPADLAFRKVVWANVLAHEMFHYWNGTYFLRGKNVPEHYWFSEGFTEYYSNLSLIRAGLITQNEFYQKLAFQFSRYFTARFLNPPPHPSLVEAGYQKGKNWSLIYGGGATVAFILDVMIRSASNSTRSLDDVMKYLYWQYGKPGIPIGQQHLLQAMEKATGSNFREFFDDYINGSGILPLLEACETAGLKVAFYQGEFYLKPSGNSQTIIREITDSVAQ